ncbi:hypothetical protein CP532_6367 [Ophiocordyceps camponoti-leonardi (nom. inval.)]|nr:hypothetical protein CP532_6367 [Ophiocordyceps camponoti-leonardi (nom. inval.)]
MSLPDDDSQGAFPWHLPVFDAHCHPTDTMASLVTALPSMRATALVIMATRSQDQHLVAQVSSGEDNKGKLIPSFGWHPWFSHQLYDDDEEASPTFRPPSPPHEDDAADTLHKAKMAHYRAVLVPSPEEDDEFIRSLPTPTALSSCIAATRSRLASHPHALVGEAGLDKAFRIPRAWDPSTASSRDAALTPGGREGRLLSSYRVRMSHQQAVLAQQLRLAAAERRPVSLHGVQAHGVLFDTVSACWKGFERRVPSRRERKSNNEVEKPPSSEDEESVTNEEEMESAAAKPYPPRICLHSFSGSVEILSQWMQPSVPADIFVSFSAAVNLGAEDAGRVKLEPVICAVPDDRILVESDLHEAGPRMDAALEHMYRVVCAAKGWSLEDGVCRIGRNFRRFVYDSSDEPIE